jgi:hypothetical protein
MKTLKTGPEVSASARTHSSNQRCYAPKSRNSAECASTFKTASTTLLPSDESHFMPSWPLWRQLKAVGQEKRASLQRTALGRGEHAN